MAGFNLKAAIADFLGNPFTSANRLPVQNQHDQPLTDTQLRKKRVLVANRNGSFRARLERESMPLNGIYTTRTGATPVNTNLLGNSPGPTASWWLDNLQITCNETTTVAVQLNGAYNPAIGWYMPYTIPAGAIATSIPINAFISANTSLTVTVLTASTNSTYQITTAVQGKIVSADFLREEADCLLLQIGDSIGSGSGISTTEQNYNYKLRDALDVATGRKWRVIRKSMGSMSSTHMEALRIGDKLDSIQPHVVVYNMGMNDGTGNTYTANLDAMTNYLQRQYPFALKVICGPTRRTDSQETNLVAIRNYAQTKVQALNSAGDNTFQFVNLGSLPPWDSTNHTTYAPDGTHPNANGHTLMFNQAWATVFTANSNYWINQLIGLVYN